MTKNTRAILVIHEFRVPFNEMASLSRIAHERNITLIEDCAHTIDSLHKGRHVGTLGTHVILSFPKIFPLKSGGALIGPSVEYCPTKREMLVVREIEKQISKHLGSIDWISKRRRLVYSKLSENATSIGLKAFYAPSE